MLLAELTNNSFFIELLEKGGLPALTIGVLMTVFIFVWKSGAKAEAKREQVRAEALLAVATERVEARKRESEQYNELMKAYEGIVTQFIGLTRETTRAVTALSERVGQCPLKNSPAEIIRNDMEG